MHIFLTRLVLLLTLASCASGHRNTSIEMRKLVAAGMYDEAIVLLQASDLATDEKSKLLLYTELGLIEHYRGNYQASSVALTQAKSIIDELYTTRVSGKVGSILSNDNADFYYGEKYEASLVYFYLSLNSYIQGMKETDAVKRKDHFLRARAEVLDWDSFLSEIKKERLGKVIFKEDLLAKVFGGLVHESQGTLNDDQIALQLYKDANDVFFKNYNLFPSYNNSFENFRKDFELFPKIPMKEVEGKYVLKTPHSETFKNFLNSKITQLTSKLKRKPSSKEGNISFLIQDGMIAEKAPHVYEIPMAWGVNQGAALSLGMGLKITFELPTVLGVEKLETGKVQALNEAGVVVKEVDISVVAPLGELAEQAIKEHSSSIAAKTAARVTAKHVAAFLASSATMQAAKRNNNSMVALFAMAGHAAAVAGINNSEKADVRFWSTLPSSIRMGYMALPAGSYKFQAVYDSGPSKRIVELGTSTIVANSNQFIMDNKDLRFKATIPQYLEPIKMPGVANPVASESNGPILPTGCSQNTECPEGYVCATVRGEYPGSCAATGFLGGTGRVISSVSCSKDAECGTGRVCATVRGEFPGSCADR